MNTSHLGISLYISTLPSSVVTISNVVARQRPIASPETILTVPHRSIRRARILGIVQWVSATRVSITGIGFTQYMAENLPYCSHSPHSHRINWDWHTVMLGDLAPILRRPRRGSKPAGRPSCLHARSAIADSYRYRSHDETLSPQASAGSGGRLGELHEGGRHCDSRVLRNY